MYEFEIMLTGYTIVLGGSSVAISRYLNKKPLNKINSELAKIQAALHNAETEIKKLKKA
jgi:hypothetical protein